MQSNSHEKLQTAVRERFVPYLIIFTALGMLMCCSLACLLALVGFAISLLKEVPFSAFNDIFQYQSEIFALSFGMLAVNSIMIYITLSNPFPSDDPAVLEDFLNGRMISKYVLIVSWMVLLSSFFLSHVF